MSQFSILNCDFYLLTMAQTLFSSDVYAKQIHSSIDTFEVFHRRSPFKGGYAIVAGVSDVVSTLKDWHVSDNDISVLRAHKDVKGKRIFSDEFLDFIRNSKMELTIDAMRDGDLVFPNEPIMRITGPSWQTFIIEAMVLNLINSSSIIATKASRIYFAANKNGKQKKLLDFSLRRAISPKASVETKAAYIGGFDSTSNVSIASKYEIPVSGTHSHALVMKYGDELEAFKEYLKVMPNNATLLVDTYDSINGVRNAIEASRQTGIKLTAIRLDSGDLGYLAKKIRIILDNAGMTKTLIIATNDLDEYTVNSLLHEQNAPIDAFGVGTKIAVPQDSLGAVYKLKTSDGVDKIKISEQEIKTTIPGATNTIRILDDEDMFLGDVIVPAKLKCVTDGELNQDITSYNLANSRYKTYPKGTKAISLLQPIFAKGKIVEDVSLLSLEEMRKFKIENFKKLNDEHKRLYSPHLYIAGLEKGLYNRRKKMVETINAHI